MAELMTAENKVKTVVLDEIAKTDYFWLEFWS